MTQTKKQRTNRSTVVHRLLLTIHLAFLCCGFLGILLGNAPALARSDATHVSRDAYSQPAQSTGSQVVYLLSFSGAVTPVLDYYLQENIAAADAAGAALIVLQLDTPGGSIDITQSITQEMLASPVPIAVYVAPSAARAGSAGTFITLAGHVAAMAPGSSIGAASPVSAAGEDIGETMDAKIRNILSADIENLAARRGEEAVAWAIAAVQDAEAATADRALEIGVIDFIASDVSDLLDQIDGFTVTVLGEEVTLETNRAIITERPLTSLQEFLNFISNPTVASLLLAVGSAGLLAEVWNPGTWIPGIIGAICLLLGLYALGQIEANFAGLGLMAVALVLFVAEAFTPTFGALAAAGAVAFALGGALLFDTPGIATPWITILSLAISLGLFTFFAGAKGLAIQSRPTITGSEGMIGQHAKVRESFAAGEMGRVFVDGEWWHAELVSATAMTSQAPPAAADLDDATAPPVTAVQIGETVEIVGRNGYTLLVKPL